LTVLLLLVGFAVILAGALLFTNAVEWLGHRIGLGTGAVGSILAGVSTALPESTIPVIAIVGGKQGSESVAVGAIIGAPLMLATIAMALVGLSAIAFKSRREQRERLKAHHPTLRRDLSFFLFIFGTALALGAGAPASVRYTSAPLFVLAYALYVTFSIRHSGPVQTEDELEPLKLDPSPRDPPANWSIALQFLIGLAAIVGGAHLFVEEVLALSEDLGVDPIVLSLLLAPLATELPEKANSVFWIRDGKDMLALGNITGAMVFQATLPVAFGVAFTSWTYDRHAILASAFALAGGGIALWTLQLKRRFTPLAILAWATLFSTFATVTLVST
jgi:cation:H+ antiporter